MDESLDGGVSFLDCWITRDERSIISMRWWQKDCSSKQILNFHSHHPYRLKWNVMKEYVRHALSITSTSLRYLTIRNLKFTMKRNLKFTMKRSSYPPNFYTKILNSFAVGIGSTHPITDLDGFRITDLDGFRIISSIGDTDPTVSISEEFEAAEEFEARRSVISKDNDNECPISYVSVPFVNDHATNKMKRILSNHNVRCRVAPRLMNTNRSVIFAKLKDTKMLKEMKYAIFILKCKDCIFTQVARTNNLDLERTIKSIMNNENSLSRIHSRRCTHVMLPDPVYVKTFSSKFELDIAFHSRRF